MVTHYRRDGVCCIQVLPKTMTNVILTVLIFALGIRPLELARLEFWSSMETCSPSVNVNTRTVKVCNIEQNNTDRLPGMVAGSRLRSGSYVRKRLVSTQWRVKVVYKAKFSFWKIEIRQICVFFSKYFSTNSCKLLCIFPYSGPQLRSVKRLKVCNYKSSWHSFNLY